MWRQQPPLLTTRHFSFPYLPFGKSYFAVIDVEALVLHSTRSSNAINVVEQVALLLVDQWGREVLAEKHWIYQPLDTLQVAAAYNVKLDEVKRSSDAYKRITRDDPVHKDIHRYERWSDVRKRVKGICHDYAVKVYAKGMTLENSVFYGELELYDLEDYGCPRYPFPIHDPLAECRFFAQYVPETYPRPFYVF